MPVFLLWITLSFLTKNNSERPVDALAVKNIPHPLTDNLKSRDASASKKVTAAKILALLKLTHVGQISQNGENGQIMAFWIFLKLYCDQTVWFFFKFSQLFWRDFVCNSLKMFSFWFLAHLEPELELFEVWEIIVLQITITIIANVINFKQL